jgi:hypothetical protein
MRNFRVYANCGYVRVRSSTDLTVRSIRRIVLCHPDSWCCLPGVQGWLRASRYPRRVSTSPG